MNHATIGDSFAKACAGILDLERVLSRISAGKCKVPVFMKLLANLSALSKVFAELKEDDSEFSSALLQQLIARTPLLGPKLKIIKKTFTEEAGERKPYRY